ncbi:MAG TPA: sialidase family protein [Flavitalea sp.]|nr:sialidase family protein [Flavitalea sp.]
MKTTLTFLLAFTLSLTIANANESPTPLGGGQMPAVTSDAKGNLHLVYGLGDNLLYRYSSDKGRTFSKPQLIATIKDLLDFATRGPQIAVTENGLSVLAPTKVGNIWSFIKTGNGKWIKTARINDVDSVNGEGFVALGSNGKSKLCAVWYDLRGNRRNKLYGSTSEDGGKTWSANSKVYSSPDTTICECCRTTLAMRGNKVYVMFRNQLYGKRDLYVISSSDAGKTFGQPKKLGIGTWELNGCPMDGGDITITADGTVQTVWRRESKVFFCEPGKPETAIGEGRSSTLESINGEPAFAWITKGNVICLLPNGTSRNLGKGDSPVLKTINNKNLLCIWENEKQLYSTIITL